MHVEAYSSLPDPADLAALPEDPARETEFAEPVRQLPEAVQAIQDRFSESIGDRAEFSDEAVRRLKDSAYKKFQNGGYSLKSIDSRIAAVRQEINSVWSSAWSDDVKYRKISSLENEISLLQAGQFNFYRNGFSGVV